MQGFVPFGPDHLAVLSGVGLIAAALILNRTRLRARDDRWLRRGIAAFIVANELIAYGIAAANGDARLPLQFCDLALILTIWALLSLRPSVSLLAYFWGLAGSLHAILTPDLWEGFPDYWWFKFFISHCGIVLSVIYLAVTGRVKPTHRSIWWIWLVTNLYAVCVGCVNWAMGTNFGYLAHKPIQPSLLDSFGPWPYYILGMEVAALASFYLYYAPFALARRFAKRRI